MCVSSEKQRQEKKETCVSSVTEGAISVVRSEREREIRIRSLADGELLEVTLARS